MAQIIDPLPKGSSLSDPDTTSADADSDSAILCCYVNATSKIQVARITNVSDWYFERVVFPGQRLMFEALPSALLEIHTGMMASSILSDTIPCQRLMLDTEMPTVVTSPAMEASPQSSSAGADAVPVGATSD